MSKRLYIRDNFIPYDYWYTANVKGYIHVDFYNVPEDVENLLDVARDENQNEEFDYTMKM